MLTKDKAEEILLWAGTLNPGAWVDHSRVVARAAETIAERCNLDSDRAYISGLLHDIGRYEGIRELHHVYAGYDLMAKQGYNAISEICLSHSFPSQHIGEYSGEITDCTDEEISIITSYLSKAIYNDYDKLIQICDAIGSAQGVCLIEVRLLDVIRRRGFNDFTLKKWESIFSLKEYFDGLCKTNIYDLFYEEIREVSFR